MFKKKAQREIRQIANSGIYSYYVKPRSFRNKPHSANFIKGGLTVLISVLVIFTVVKASVSTFDVPSGEPAATFYSLPEIYDFITANTAATVDSPALDWSVSLQGTGHTLTEIYNALTGLITAENVFTDITYLGTTGTLKLACATSTFDGTSNLVATAYDGSGNGANRWCMATSTASASASDIVLYKSAWVNGIEINGSFASTTETATTTGVDITPPAGTWFSKITVAITNLIASVIKSGETVGGVSGSLLPSGGTATAANVASGATFFGASQTNWTLQTGTFDPWTPQKLQTIDDWLNSGGIVGEYTAEEATWSAVSGSPFNAGFATSSTPLNYYPVGSNMYLMSGVVKQDARTGLWWSDVASIGAVTAVATTTTNDFSLTIPRVTGTGDGTRPWDTATTTATNGNAINFCNALNNISFGGHNDWYLPTQKQLQQAYIDGSANNLPNPGYTFWSSTEYYNTTAIAWPVTLTSGYTNVTTKASSNYVRCVRP